MMNASASQGISEQAAVSLRRLARLVCLSIALGFVIQGVVLALLVWERGAGGVNLFVNAAAGVSWTLLVCTGVGIGTLITQGRPYLTGLVSAAVAPASLAAAKAAGKALSGWVGAVQSQAILSTGTISTLRAFEYGLLGWLLGRLVASKEARPAAYLGAGAAAGGLFGTAVTLMTVQAASVAGKPLTGVRVATTALNEVVFPIGCALVIYLGLEVSRSLKLVGPGQVAGS